MKILVPISNVPDTTTKIAFTNGDTEFNAAGVQFIINPYDEWYALVRALELKEAGKAEKVTLIHVGLADSDSTIRKGFALGADDGVRIDAEGPDAYFVAEQIANYAKANGYELIMVGKETINYNGSSVGAMVSGFMDLPFVSYASKLDMAGNTANIERDIEGGKEVLSVDVPFVVSCAKGMAEARIPNMKGIMSAKTKPLNVVAPQGVGSLTSVVKYELPPAKSACKMVSADQPEELIRLLHEEAKMI